MKDKDVKYINSGTQLEFNLDGFAINPFDNSTAFFAADWRDIILGVAGTGNIKVLGSNQVLPPDFMAGSTIDNLYTGIILADLTIPNTYYNGSVGVTVAGATALVEVNTNLLTWISIQRTVDTVETKLTFTNAQ